MMGNIQLHDKRFRPFIGADAIDDAIARMATQMNIGLKDDAPLFLGILNGSFMFVSDLMKHITIPGTQISFVKVASYSGTRSSGEVQELIGLTEEISGRTVVILEDIIDSGRSMSHLLCYLHARKPRKIIVATLFFKPAALVCPVPVDYCGLELGNDFIVGRGLDYNGLGRNYPDLYILDESNESR